MESIVLGCCIFSILFHVLAFFLESVWWNSKKTHKIFGVKTEDSSKVAGFAFNQGFYNLLLAIIELYGVFLVHFGGDDRYMFGKGLICAACFVMAGAGAVLVLYGGVRYLKVGIMQGLAPAYVVYSCL